MREFLRFWRNKVMSAPYRFRRAKVAESLRRLIEKGGDTHGA